MTVKSQFQWYPSATEVVNASVKNYNLIYYDNSPLVYYDYEDWLLLGTYSGEYTPKIFTINPATNGIIINTVDAYYSVDYVGSKTPEYLTSNTQTPLLPVSHHFCIVYKAAYEVAIYLGNAEMMSLKPKRNMISLYLLC